MTEEGRAEDGKELGAGSGDSGNQREKGVGFADGEKATVEAGFLNEPIGDFGSSARSDPLV